MSEYQCYEFLAVDEALTPKQQRELRAISTRAEISASRFWNEYQFGDLKAEPKELLRKYFDVHHYFANWGSQHFMARLPANRVELATLKPYFSGYGAALTRTGKHVLLEFWADDDAEPYDNPSEGGQLADFVPLRSQLLQGDLRAAYLGWLAGVDRAADDAAQEPPVPPGLDTLNGALQALASLLGLRPSLLEAAAERSPRLKFDVKAARHWLSQRTAGETQKLLLRAMQDPSLSVGAELLANYNKTERASARLEPRTVQQLRERSEELR